MRFWKPASPAKLTIEDSEDGVRFRVQQQLSPPAAAWSLVFATFTASFLTGILSSEWHWQRMVLVVVGGLGTGTYFARPRVVFTAFRADGISVRGGLGSGFFVPKKIPLQEVAELLWQPEWNGGPESSDQPSGLYARRGLLLVCLVPYLSAEQAYRAIKAIEQRFSWAERNDPRQNTLLFTDDLVRLGLDRER